MVLDNKLNPNIKADTVRSSDLKAASGSQMGGSGQAGSFTVTEGGNDYNPNYYNEQLVKQQQLDAEEGLTAQTANAEEQGSLADTESVMEGASNDSELLGMIPTYGTADKQQITGSDVKSFFDVDTVEKEVDPIHAVYKEWSTGKGEYKDIKTWNAVKTEFYGTSMTGDMGGPAAEIDSQSLKNSDFGIGDYLGSLLPQSAEAVQLEKDRIKAEKAAEAVEAKAAEALLPTPYSLRGGPAAESAIKAANLKLTYYKVDPITNEYINESGAVRSDLAWSPEAMRGYAPESMTGKSLFNSKTSWKLTGTDEYGKNPQTATKFATSLPAGYDASAEAKKAIEIARSQQENPEAWEGIDAATWGGSFGADADHQGIANMTGLPVNVGMNTDAQTDENPDGGYMMQAMPEFDNPKGGPSWISTADLDAAYGPGKGQAGVQEQYNMQNANRAFNIILKDWRTNHMTTGYTAKTDQAKSTAKANAQGFVYQKKALIDSWQGDGTSNGKFNDYKKMFKSDLDKRYKNMYSSSGTLSGFQPKVQKDTYTKYSSTQQGGDRVSGEQVRGGGGSGFGFMPQQNLTRQPSNTTSTNPYLFDLNKAGSFSSSDGKKIKPKLMTWKDTGFYQSIQ